MQFGMSEKYQSIAYKKDKVISNWLVEVKYIEEVGKNYQRYLNSMKKLSMNSNGFDFVLTVYIIKLWWIFHLRKIVCKRFLKTDSIKRWQETRCKTWYEKYILLKISNKQTVVKQWLLNGRYFGIKRFELTSPRTNSDKLLPPRSIRRQDIAPSSKSSKEVRKIFFFYRWNYELTTLSINMATEANSLFGSASVLRTVLVYSIVSIWYFS